MDRGVGSHSNVVSSIDYIRDHMSLRSSYRLCLICELFIHNLLTVGYRYQNVFVFFGSDKYHQIDRSLYVCTFIRPSDSDTGLSTGALDQGSRVPESPFSG